MIINRGPLHNGSLVIEFISERRISIMRSVDLLLVSIAVSVILVWAMTELKLAIHRYQKWKHLVEILEAD